MANTFTRFYQAGVGTSAATLLTAAQFTQTTVIGCTIANTTASPISTDVYVTANASVVASISSTTMTVTFVNSGALTVGMAVTGAAANTIITAFGSGTGGVGTYTVSIAQSLGSSTLGASQNIYVVKGATVPVGGSLAIIGADGKIVMNTGDTFNVVSNAATSADVLVSALLIT